MDRKRALRLFGGAAGVMAAGAALLAISVAARGIENPALEPPTALPGEGIETRIELAQATPAPAMTKVSFSSDQADRGETRFERDCVDCHGEDLNGGLLGGPPLRGLSFEQKFLNGASAAGLFVFMSTLMPPDSPGRFSPAIYADLMAYILKRNGFRAGAELPSTVEALSTLILEK